MRVPWLGDVLRGAGLTVVNVGDPHGRGRQMDTVYGVVVHDTVTTTAWTDERVDALLRDGRSDLLGPLAQLGVDRQGRFRFVADGKSNHNGYGTWGNNTVGIEVYCAGGLSGREEPWNDRQREAVVRGARAILARLNLGRSDYWNPRVAGHKETDPRRKVDPYRIDMNRLRADVAQQRETRRYQMVIYAKRGTPDTLAALAVHAAAPKGVVTSDLAEAKAALDRGEKVYAVGGPAARDLPGAIAVVGASAVETGQKVFALAKGGW